MQIKSTISLAALLLISGALFIRGSRVNQSSLNNSLQSAGFSIPASVKAIIDQKCYSCHSLKGKSPDARKSLIWDSIPHFDKAKLVAKLSDIYDVLDQGTMPPKEMVEKIPSAQLSDEERLSLKSWAEAAADSLLK